MQADPIRAPARAQDLILRQRVRGYRAGDLEAAYPSLGIEEGYLYAYGFLSRALWHHLHPRVAGSRKLSKLERSLLERVREHGPTHPRELEAHFGARRVVNAWGGTSKATTYALERLHYHGHLRIVRRDTGLRVYEAAPAREGGAIAAEARLDELVLAVAHVLAPVAEKSLHTIAAYLRRTIPRAPGHVAAIRALVARGALARAVVDGEGYLWPGGSEAGAYDAGERRVRFLAPFDPVVWDRRRFEHLWGWAYRFEAYTPVAKRVRGYYAMPLLFDEGVIGWANVSRAAGSGTGPLDVQLGFVRSRPRDRGFSRAVDAEVARMEAFLATEPRGD